MTGAAPDRRVRKSTSSDKRRKPSSLLKATSQTLRSMERRPAFRQGLSSWGSVKLSRSPIRRRRQPRSGRSRLSRLQRPYLRVAFLREGVFEKKIFRCGRRFRCRRLRSAAVTRLWPRGLRSRRPHSSLISGLLGARRHLQAQGLALPLRARRRMALGPVRPSSGSRRRIWGADLTAKTLAQWTSKGALPRWD